MHNQKRNLIITTTLKREGRASGIAVLVGVGFVLLTYLLGFILHSNFESLWVSIEGIPHIVPPLLILVLVFYFLITPYSDFKWAIQNGISRKTFWQGRIIAMLLLVIMVWFIAMLITLLYRPAFLATAGLILKAARNTFLTYLSSTLTMMAIGNGFALLSRKWKWIVGIGGPVIVFICLSYLGMAAVHLGVESLLDNNLFINIMSSTTTWWIVLLIYLLIMLVLTKVFSDRLQLRRD